MRIAAVLVLLGCGGPPVPTCKDALAHAKLTLDAEVQVCERNHWSGDVRRCLATAPDPRAVKHCLEPVELDLAAIYREQSDQLARAAAEQQARLAALQARVGSAKADVDALVKQSDELGTQVEKAIAALASATSDAERAALKAAIERLQREEAEVSARLGSASAAANANVDEAIRILDGSGSAR